MRRIEHKTITVIQMSEPSDSCCVCDEETWMDYGLPCYEGWIVPANWQGEWGGFTACQRCYFLFSAIDKPLPLLQAKKSLAELSRFSVI